MINRLEQIRDGLISPTDFDKRFYTHELEEFSRYRTKGIPDGTNNEDFYFNAHAASLEVYGVNEISGRLYPPDVPYPDWAGY